MANDRLERFRTELIGRQVTDTQVDEEGIGLAFEGNWNLAIWGAAKLTDGGALVDISNIARLKRLVLKEFVGDSREEHLVFDAVPQIELIVSLGSESQKAPESMALYGPNNYIVVWND